MHIQLQTNSWFCQRVSSTRYINCWHSLCSLPKQQTMLHYNCQVWCSTHEYIMTIAYLGWIFFHFLVKSPSVCACVHAIQLKWAEQNSPYWNRFILGEFFKCTVQMNCLWIFLKFKFFELFYFHSIFINKQLKIFEWIEKTQIQLHSTIQNEHLVVSHVGNSILIHTEIESMNWNRFDWFTTLRTSCFENALNFSQFMRKIRNRFFLCKFIRA